MDSMSPPDSRPEAFAASTDLVAAEAFRVTNADEYRACATLRQRIKTWRGAAYDVMRAKLKPFEEGIKGVRDLFPIERADAAVKLLDAQMKTYDDEQERLRKEEERRLQEEERRRREEAQRLADEEAARVRAEAQARADAERAEADRLAQEVADEAEAERLRREADERANATLHEAELQASDVQHEAAVVAAAPLPIIAREQVEVPGHSRRAPWKGRVLDLDEVIRGVIAGETPFAVARQILEINQTGLNNQAKALGAHMKIRGTEAYQDRGFASRSRA